MGSNFTTSEDTNWYMNSSFKFVKGLPSNSQTPSYKVIDGTVIDAPDSSDLAGMRVYFFVVPVGGVASATVADGKYGYTSIPAVTFPTPKGGVAATGIAVLGTKQDPVSTIVGNTSYVQSINITNPGSGYKTARVPKIAPPGAVDTVTVATPGNGYTNTNNFSIVGSSSMAHRRSTREVARAAK